MKTYKITFKMESPVCFIDRPHFDGILLYCLMKEKYGNMPVDFTESELSGLPLQWSSDNYPLASVMFFDKKKAVEYTGSWKKRWDNKNDDLADFGKNIRKVAVNAGKFKSYDMPINLWQIPEIWFYFQSDDIQRVQKLLLTQLAGIGKKVSQGYGFYSHFDITEENNISFDTHLLRPLRRDSENAILLLNNLFEKRKNFSLSTRYMAWRPPYTNPENFTNCFYPEDSL